MSAKRRPSNQRPTMSVRARLLWMCLGLFAMLDRQPVSAQLDMECYPNGTMYVQNPNATEYRSAYVADSTARCTAVFSEDFTVITITNCSKDDDIVVQLEKEQQSTVLIGKKGAFLGIIHCKEDGIVKNVSQGMAVTFTPEVKTAPILTIPVSSYTRLGGFNGDVVTSGVTGTVVTWTFELPEPYYMKILSCIAYPGTSVSETINAQLLSGRCSSNKVIVADINPADVTVANGNRIYFLQLTLFRFFSDDKVLIQCQLKICPGGGQSNCAMNETCPSRKKRSTSDPGASSSGEPGQNADLLGLAEARFRAFVSYQDLLENASCVKIQPCLTIVVSLLLLVSACA